MPSIELSHAYMVTPIDDLNICIASVSLVRGEEVDVSLRRVKIAHQQAGRLQPELGRKLGGSRDINCDAFASHSSVSFWKRIGTQVDDHHPTSLREKNIKPGVRFNNNNSKKKHLCNSALKRQVEQNLSGLDESQQILARTTRPSRN